MKTLCMTIEPLSAFGTPLKGDTLFGQFCWQAAYDETLLSVPFSEALAMYATRPFAVFSSAFPALPEGGIALPRPQSPLELLFDLSDLGRDERIGERKKLKKKKWLLCHRDRSLPNLRAARYLSDEEFAEAAGLDTQGAPISEFLHSHNSINRLSGTTGEGFAPYATRVDVHAPGLKLALFVGHDPTVLSQDALVRGLERIGALGFGRDASTGLGRFRVCDCRPAELARLGAAQPNALYTLAPCVPDMALYLDALFTPFTRFGRHGDHLATSGKPFKNPVIMADEGALFFPKDLAAALEYPYLGKALGGLSKIQEGTVGQGYALYLPVGLEVAQ
ncbi:type III-A CRISPR-associated RAMP protein Csm4 [Geoalkalibacter sp.]|uniref:type III-A CRISPR-associated RAMP protein Csm4 n=1 Tax=Geoalkalibacter sp. TaxID=3041440 RepID=UPI00272ED8C1|nr:hypothetical protein [Geoalkalibacter sp.]